ncbi:MAG: hypothetical protein JWN97_2585 [Nocardioides sp.]|nr:hypothetical protein [Nocardioides sp.]
MSTLVISSHEDAIAAVPYVLGFHPQESLVLVPFNQALPWVRVDIPATDADRSQLWDGSLREALVAHARRADGPVGMAVLCFTSDQANAAASSHDIGRRLGEIGIRTPVRLWTNDSVWVEFNTSANGRCSQDAADKMAATSVYSGSARPAASRETMAASMAGDRKPVAALLKDDTAADATPAAEREWAGMRVAEFLVDGARLSDADAARLLVAVQATSTRDALWGQMTRETSRDHQALWIDLTRRAPRPGTRPRSVTSRVLQLAGRRWGQGVVRPGPSACRPALLNGRDRSRRLGSRAAAQRVGRPPDGARGTYVCVGRVFRPASYRGLPAPRAAERWVERRSLCAPAVTGCQEDGDHDERCGGDGPSRSGEAPGHGLGLVAGRGVLLPDAGEQEDP